MNQIDADFRLYSCPGGETVTFQFTQSHASSRVFYRIGKNGPMIKINGTTVNIGITQNTIIYLNFFFAASTGSCIIQLNGSNGGSFPDNPSVKAVGNFVLERKYTFSV